MFFALKLKPNLYFLRGIDVFLVCDNVFNAGVWLSGGGFVSSVFE